MQKRQTKIGLNVHIYPAKFENESRILKITNFLVKNGIVENILVVGLISGAAGTYKEAIDESRDVLRVNTKFGDNQLLYKLLSFVEWYVKVIVYLRCHVIGMVNCHSLSALPLSVFLKLWHNSILIYEPHELETETKGCTGLKKVLAKMVERIFIRYADKIIVVSDSIRDAYEKMYNLKSPPPVILNCPNYIPQVRSNYFRDFFGIKPNAIIFLYQGALSVGRGVSTILKAFKKNTDPNKVIIFMGSGPLEGEIKEASENGEGIYFHPAVPSDVVLQYTSSADIGLHFIQNTCLNHYYCLPNKLFEYIMSGLPVVVSNMHDMSLFVKRTKTGIVAFDDTPEGVLAAINRLSLLDINSLKKNVIETAKKYCWKEQEKILAASYKNLR